MSDKGQVDEIAEIRKSLIIMFGEDDIDPSNALSAMIMLSARLAMDGGVGKNKFVEGCRMAYNAEKKGKESKMLRERFKVIDGG